MLFRPDFTRTGLNRMPLGGLGRILLLGGLTLVLGVGVFLALTFWARETPVDPGAPTTAQAPVQPAAPASAAPVPVGESTTAAREPAELTDDRNHGDWRHACLTRKDGVRVCSIVQNLVHQESGRILLSWRIVRNADSLTSVWQTPQNVLLSNGLRIDAGLPEPIVLPYQSCNAGHCVATANLAADFVDRMQGVTDLAVTMVLTNGRGLRLKISTNGLADALQDLRSQGTGEALRGTADR